MKGNVSAGLDVFTSSSERGTFAFFVHWLWEEEEDVEDDEGS